MELPEIVRPVRLTADDKSVDAQVRLSNDRTKVVLCFEDGHRVEMTWGVLREAAHQEDWKLSRDYSAILIEARWIFKCEGYRKDPAYQSVKGLIPKHLECRLARGLLERYLETPPGGWPETQQAFRHLLDLGDWIDGLTHEGLVQLGLLLGMRPHRDRLSDEQRAVRW